MGSVEKTGMHLSKNKPGFRVKPGMMGKKERRKLDG
jgi:hypothetical protein